jgi:hypothetical protein
LVLEVVATCSVATGLLHHVSCFVGQELATACAGQWSVSGEVHHATVGEGLGIEFASPAISGRALAYFDGCGRRSHLPLDTGADIARQADS